MDAKTFLDNFGHIADAPNGVKKLRAFVLELAVQGKLLSQNCNDKPISELLPKLEAEQKRLEKAKEISKLKPVDDIAESELAFELPAGWAWLRLGELGYWAIGSGFPKSAQGHTDKEILFCKVSDMNLPGNEKWINSTVNTIDETLVKKIRAKVLKSGTVIFPKIGGAIATNKRRILVRPSVIDNNCLGITPSVICDTDWLFLLLTSMDLTQYQAGTSVPALSQGTLGMIVTAVPPLEEQKRIVAKVDQLMALCDQLQTQQKQKAQTRVALNNAALDKVLTAQNPDEFNQHWRRITNNFQYLYDNRENLTKLRTAFLQLAVQGKLVEQQLEGDPAHVLLELADSERDITMKNIKSRKFIIPEIEPEEVPFDLPQNWVWARIGNISSLISGKGFKAAEYSDKGARLFQIANVSFGETKWEVENYLPTDYMKKYPELILDEGDVLIALNRPLLKMKMKVAIITKPDLPSILYQRVGKFVFFGSCIDTKYFFYYLQSPLFIDALYDNLQGSDQPFINQSQLVKFYISLPPFEEQKRIVARVEQLMALCDQLEAKLKQTHITSEKLVEATTKALVA